MAPQQNSTLIDENIVDCPSLLNIPEEISRYSPILPPKYKENFDSNNNKGGKKSNNYNQTQDINKIPKWELTEKEARHYYKNKHYCHGSYRSSNSRRSRSISLYGANSTVEQGHIEITIFLDDEPRYVSGVTNKTTCNDIIKALIDDETGNGNKKYCQHQKDGTASRDYSDYVITECWRGIERSYDGNVAILPIWKAWSRVHNEIRLNLKHHKDIRDPTKALKTNTTLSSIRAYICKILNFGGSKKHKSKAKKLKSDEKGSQPISNGIMILMDTETKMKKKVLVESGSKNMEDNNKTSNIKGIGKHSDTSNEAKTATNKEKLYKLSETRSSVRKRRSASRRTNKKVTQDGKHDYIHHNQPNNFLRKRKDSCIRGSLRNKIARKNVEMNELFQREYALTKELTKKCKMYKVQNELYTMSDLNLEMSVGQIQKSIEECAKEIIQTEHELLKVKNEIKQDISIINNLKHLTIDTDLNKSKVPIHIENILKTNPDMEPTPNATSKPTASCEKMLFVDNIYEFCDNNASMLV